MTIETKFRVFMNNRADSLSTGMVRIIKNKFHLTTMESMAHDFDRLADAEGAAEHFRKRFSHNKWVDVWIERVDLYDGLVDDVDNMAML